MPNGAPTPQEMLSAYKTAELEILSGAQESRIGDRMVTRADLEFIQKGREYWERRCAAAAAGSGGLTFSTARFD